MELKEPILKILNKVYEPSIMFETTFKNYDLAIKTDDEGRPIMLFMGKKSPSGLVKGDRFARRLKQNQQGEIIKDHWEHKGKAT